jgi:putative ABC transport system ATP-binding protein
VSQLDVRAVTTLHVGPATFSVKPGTCVALWGPSGSGKSLLLRALADLDPHGGDALVDGEAQSAMSAPEWRQRVGYLSTESAWWAPLVGDHFPEDVSNTEFVALGFDEDVVTWEVDRMSSGERQRLALLRLLAHKPEALLLDEPTANLDAESGTRVEALVAQYRDERGASILWVGHDAAQRKRVANSELSIVDGTVVQA